MPKKVAGDIAVTVGADVSALQTGMRRGARSVQNFGNSADQAAKRVARLSTFLSTAVVGSAVLATRSTLNYARELQNLSRLAGVGVVEFQKLAAAGETVGFSQEKVADIFKDVNDKFGDFMANGAGPLKDFFENIAPAVGVTAEQFARLSGPEALQLYVTSLERAGVTQQQMTFYMEALANDATALIPLFRQNGRELQNLGDAAEKAGRIMSSEMIASGVEADRKFRELSRTIQDQAKKAILEYSDEIIALGNWVSTVAIPALVSFGKAFVSFLEKLTPAIDALRAFMSLAKAAAGVEVGSAEYNPEEQARIDADTRAARGGDDPSSTGQFYVDDEGNVQEYGSGTPSIPGITAPKASIVPLVNRSGRRSGGGGGGRRGGGGAASGPDREDFELLMSQLATEAEAIEIWREEQLEKLREYRNAKIATEEEFNEAERRIQQEHGERLAQLEMDAQRARLQIISGAFSDLASLMTTGNEKLFKIGKAAATAEAIVSGYQAAVDAWQKGMKTGGPPVAAAFTAASLARTGALISSISSQQIGGGVGGAAGVAAGVGAVPQVSNISTLQIEGIGADQFISARQLRGIIAQINDMQEGGTVVRLV